MTYQTLKTNIERELLMVLILGLRHNNISKPRAKEVTKQLLKVLRGTDSTQEVLDNISRICQIFPELIDPYIKVAKKYEEEDVKERIDRVLNSLQNSDEPKIEVN